MIVATQATATANRKNARETRAWCECTCALCACVCRVWVLWLSETQSNFVVGQLLPVTRVYVHES